MLLLLLLLLEQRLLQAVALPSQLWWLPRTHLHTVLLLRCAEQLLLLLVQLLSPHPHLHNLLLFPVLLLLLLLLGNHQ
jgi:hypothetical protein